MKNRLVIYANLIKDNLTKEGCEFVMQKAELVSRSMIMQFHHKNVPEQIINKTLSVLRCIYRIEYGKDVVTILLQEDLSEL